MSTKLLRIGYPFGGRQDDFYKESDAFVVCRVPNRDQYLFIPNICVSKINISVEQYRLYFAKWYQFYNYIRNHHECIEIFKHHILCHYVNIRLYPIRRLCY